MIMFFLSPYWISEYRLNQKWNLPDNKVSEGNISVDEWGGCLA